MFVLLFHDRAGPDVQPRGLRRPLPVPEPWCSELGNGHNRGTGQEAPEQARGCRWALHTSAAPPHPRPGPSSCTEGPHPRTLSLGPACQVLENRTKDSKLEMEVLENLQELKDLNQRQAHVDFEAMLRQHRLSEEERQKQEQEEDERETA